MTFPILSLDEVRSLVDERDLNFKLETVEGEQANYFSVYIFENDDYQGKLSLKAPHSNSSRRSMYTLHIKDAELCALQPVIYKVMSAARDGILDELEEEREILGV